MNESIIIQINPLCSSDNPIFARFRSKPLDNVEMSKYILRFAEVYNISVNLLIKHKTIPNPTDPSISNYN